MTADINGLEPISAPAYLRTLQRHEELHDWMVALMPRNAGGSDLNIVPPWLKQQLAAVGLQSEGTFVESFRRICSIFDVARSAFEEQVQRMPQALQEKLQLGDELAVGSLNACEFNGAVLKVPGSSDAMVIAFPLGGLHLINSCCDLLGIHLRIPSMGLFLDGFFESVGHRQTCMGRWRRVRSVTRYRRGILKRYDLPAVAMQMQVQLHRHAVLGVVDVNDFTREWLPIPIFGDPARFGHPLELGTCMSHFVRGFFVRHECAHVLLAHSPNKPDSPIEEEFAADLVAFSLGISHARTDRDRVCACAGAFLFLWIARWVEVLNEAPAFQSSHPPVEQRIARLRSLLEIASGLDRATRRITQDLVGELERLMDRLWEDSAPLRDGDVADLNSLRTAMENAIRSDTPDIFLDQVPRWLMFGAPRKLCLEIAKYRCDLEAEVAQGLQGGEAERRLGILMTVYDQAEARVSSSLYDDLIAEYSFQRRQRNRES